MRILLLLLLPLSTLAQLDTIIGGVPGTIHTVDVFIPDSDETDPMKMGPVRFDLDGIPRVAYTDPQNDAVVFNLQQRVFDFDRVEFLLRIKKRQEAIIANLEEELRLQDSNVDDMGDYIESVEKQLEIKERKERLKKIEDWLERAGGVVLLGLAAYGGYELGQFLK